MCFLMVNALSCVTRFQAGQGCCDAKLQEICLVQVRGIAGSMG